MENSGELEDFGHPLFLIDVMCFFAVHFVDIEYSLQSVTMERRTRRVIDGQGCRLL